MQTYTPEEWKRFLRYFEFYPNFLEEKVWQKFPSPHPQDDTIHHYTSKSGLLGILKEEALWMSQVTRLEDQDEVVFGRQKIIDFVEKIKKEESAESKKFPLLHLALNIFNRCYDKTFEPTVFALSFCEDGDLSSAWAKHGDNGNGFSIGFRSSHIENFIKRRASSIYSYKSVLYDNGQIDSILEEVAEGCEFLCEKRAQMKHHFDACLDWAVEEFNLALAPIPVFFKKNGWRDEREKRVMLLDERQQEKNVRFINGIEIPYYKFSLFSTCRDIKFLPISKIIFGSRVSEVDLKEVKEFAYRMGYGDVPFVPSEIQLR
jgi:hypothetical protein